MQEVMPAVQVEMDKRREFERAQREYLRKLALWNSVPEITKRRTEITKRRTEKLADLDAQELQEIEKEKIENIEYNKQTDEIRECLKRLKDGIETQTAQIDELKETNFEAYLKYNGTFDRENTERVSAMEIKLDRHLMFGSTPGIDSIRKVYASYRMVTNSDGYYHRGPIPPTLERTMDINRRMEPKKVVEKKFIMPCQNDKCNGFLSDEYKCAMCGDQCCKKCFDMVGQDKDKIKEHVCNEDQIKTAKLIKSTTKPCPKCGQRIHKISGCNQMWCTTCTCTFCYRTGEILNGAIHNPHYFQYMRNNRQNGNGNGEPANVVDIPCGDRDYTEHILNVLSRIRRSYGLVGSLTDSCNMIVSFLQLLRHNQYVMLRQIHRKVAQNNSYQDDLTKWVLKDINDDTYKEILKIKHRNGTKWVDMGYICEMFLTVGKDIRTKLSQSFNPVNRDRNITDIIDGFQLDEVQDIISKCDLEITNFIEYHNVQSKVISVSHNCRAPHYVRQYSGVFEKTSIKSNICDIRGEKTN